MHLPTYLPTDRPPELASLSFPPLFAAACARRVQEPLYTAISYPCEGWPKKKPLVYLRY